MITHWLRAIGACRSRPKVSRATLTIVVSRIDMTDPSAATPVTRHT